MNVYTVIDLSFENVQNHVHIPPHLASVGGNGCLIEGQEGDIKERKRITILGYPRNYPFGCLCDTEHHLHHRPKMILKGHVINGKFFPLVFKPSLRNKVQSTH